MPNQEGKLSEDEKEGIKKWMAEKWPEPMTCPVCKDDTWIIAEHLVTPFRAGENVTHLSGAIYPQVMLISKKCGHTIYFNAVILGLLTSKDEKNGKQ